MHAALAALAVPSSGAVPPFLTDVVALVVVAAGVAYACHRIGLVPIVGFLLAGVLIGPHGLGLVRDRAVVESAAEIGVLLLLFTIGIEFSLEKLARITRLILVGGGLQVVLTTGVVALVLAAFGVGWPAGIFSGFLVALSSTAIVTKLLADRGEATGPAGQTALGVLIFQDLAVVVMVLLVPALAGRGGSSLDVVAALGKAGAIIALVLVGARRLLPPVLEAVARTCSPDLFLLTVVAICMGTAWLAGMAGVSVALGAFLAGLVVSESPFAEHALAEILPLQILFSATFFVSIGLLFDVGYLVAHLSLVLLVVAGVVLTKGLATALSVRAAGRSVPVAGGTALLLAQVGEFSFVLERSGRELGLSPMGMGEAGSQAFIAATVILMALSPALAAGASRLWRAEVAPRVPEVVTDLDAHGLPALENHVIVAGYGRAGRTLARVLRGSGIPFVVATLSPDGAREAEREGVPVLRGDYAKRHVLELLGLARAKLVVIPDDDPGMAQRVTAVARTLAPATRIVARAHAREDAAALEAAGADRALSGELEAIVGLFDDVLRSYDVDAERMLAHEEALRRASYDLFRPEAVPELPCELSDECFSTRTLTIRAGTPIAGRRLDELGLERLGLGVRRVQADGVAWDGPPGDLVLRPGDSVTFVGAAASFAAAAGLFRRGDTFVDGDPDPARAASPLATWVDTTRPIAFTPSADTTCAHLDHVLPVRPAAQGCVECLAEGRRWVHLRVCLECGHVGCCDSSPGRHARGHFAATGHPVVRSLERGESWGWCFADDVAV